MFHWAHLLWKHVVINTVCPPLRRIWSGLKVEERLGRVTEMKLVKDESPSD